MTSAERESIGRLISLVKPHWRRMALAALCMIGVSSFTALTAYIIRPAMDDIFVKKDVHMLYLMPFIILGVFFFKCVSDWGNEYLLQFVGLSVVNSLQQRLYDHIHELPLSFFDRHSTGLLMSRIINDVNEIRDAVAKALTSLVKDSTSVVGLVFVVFYQDWKLALMATTVLPVAFYPIFLFGSKLRKFASKRQETMGLLTVVLHETISGARIVKVFGAEDYEKGRFHEHNQRALHYNLKSVWIDALSSPLMEFIGAIGIAFIIGYGGLQVIRGVSTPGTFFSLLAGLIILYRPVKNLSRTNSLIQKGIASTERVYAILNEKSDLAEKPDALELPPIRREIEFRNVSFAYDTGRTVLHDISFRVTPGEIIALVGSSGGGKTTLVNLIPRFYDATSGAILFDGVDIRDVSFRSLRKQISIVTQQSFLFNDTVRNNIAYGNRGKGIEDIVAAAKAAYAHDFIMDLPEGFDTLIGEQGIKLSGGQRQRVCIARALLKDTPILILDEATSSLDSESELEVQRALENLMQGRTTFVIAHRLSTIQHADRILVICNGKITEEGSHAMLLAQDGEYRRLHDIQFQQ